MHAYFHLCVVDPEQVTNIQVTPKCVYTRACDESINVRFTPSTSPGILYYVVNCSDNTCDPVNFGTNNDELPASAETNTVIVYAVNRCDQTSPITTSNVTFPCQCDPGPEQGISVELNLFLNCIR